MEILRQQTDSRHGNDCLIKDTVVMYTVHDKFVVQVVRRYRGWCDNGLDFRAIKEFDLRREADDYYEWLEDNEKYR